MQRRNYLLQTAIPYFLQDVVLAQNGYLGIDILKAQWQQVKEAAFGLTNEEIKVLVDQKVAQLEIILFEPLEDTIRMITARAS